MDSKLQTISLLRDLYIITGARISLHDLDFNEIAAYPKSLSKFCDFMQKSKGIRDKCIRADKEAFNKVIETGEVYSYKCHCGLTEIVAPVYNYGCISGYLMMGQIANNGDIGLIKKLVSDIIKTSDVPYSEIPVLDSKVLTSCLNVATVVASYLTESNVMEPVPRDLAENVFHYINVHYSEPISIDSLCGVFFCSRTTLMNLFKKKYGVTIGEYLNKYRLSKAEKLLKGGNKNIKTIASECGFTAQSYFSKVFLKVYGLTPVEYRKKYNQRSGQQ